MAAPAGHQVPGHLGPESVCVVDLWWVSTGSQEGGEEGVTHLPDTSAIMPFTPLVLPQGPSGDMSPCHEVTLGIGNVHPRKTG